MKDKKEKPEFLKTFSEFTIAELRMMPIPRLFSLFFREVGITFSARPVRGKVKKARIVKKSSPNTILTAAMKREPHFPLKIPSVHAPHFHLNTEGFSQAVKRVFTPGPIKADAPTKKNGKAQQEKSSKSETVVFTNDSTPGSLH